MSLDASDPGEAAVRRWNACSICHVKATAKIKLLKMPDESFMCETCAKRRQVTQVLTRPQAPSNSHYQTLGITWDASNDEVETAYRTKFRDWLTRQSEADAQ